MKETAVRERLAELAELLDTSPFLGETRDQHGLYVSDAASAHGTTEDVMDSIRTQVRYLVFDLEATRRENRYLRQMLETRRQRRGGDQQDDDIASF